MKKSKFNIIDISVVILILILILAASVRFGNYNKTNDDSAKIDTFTYKVKISNVRSYTVDAFIIGDTLCDTQTNIEIGKILEKECVEAKSYETLKNGKIIETTVPNRYDLILNVETQGTIDNSGYFANRSVELKVGSEKVIETLYAKSTGRIVEISEKIKE